MPDTPADDDRFADLFGKLPTPGRSADPDAAASMDPSGAQGDAASAVTRGSRRAAREAAARAAAAAPATEAIDTVAMESEADPGADAVAGPVAASAAVSAAVETAGQPSEDAPAAPVASPRAAGSIDALFGDEVHSADAAGNAHHDRDRRKSRIAGWVVFAVVLALLGGVAAGGLWVWNTYETQIRSFMGWEEPKDFEEGLANGEAVITIADGDVGADVSVTLFEAGVTKTSDAFYDYLIANSPDHVFHPGVYQLQLQMTSAAALEALDDPANKLEKTAQLREGLTVETSLPLLVDATDIPLEDFETAVADPSVYGVDADTLEGWLFPATYTFDPDVTAEDVIRTLVGQTVKKLDAADVPEADRQEILTIASIIEREARFQDDFYKVSRVIQNRLDIDMKLQMDSTAQYGYGQLHDGSVSSSAEALADDNPWNTYVHTGLPVGPIANPGALAIDAAMHPVDGPWLYFVTVDLDAGETVFSETYDEHLKAVEQWRSWCAANPDRGC